MKKKKKSIISRIFSSLTWLFLEGLLTILPITITIALFTFSFNLIANWLAPLHDLIDHTLLSKVPYSEILTAIVLIFLIGAIVKIFLLAPLIQSIETLISKVPLIRHVYSGIKQLVQAFGIQDKLSFKHVVFVEFPRKGLYSIGFLTSELPPEITPTNDQKYFNIFIPTTPNPTSGYFIIVPENEIQVVDITRQEAMAMIISGGIIQPERFAQKEN